MLLIPSQVDSRGMSLYCTELGFGKTDSYGVLEEDGPRNKVMVHLAVIVARIK